MDASTEEGRKELVEVLIRGAYALGYRDALDGKQPYVHIEWDGTTPILNSKRWEK